jgi:hypothetical protein
VNEGGKCGVQYKRRCSCLLRSRWNRAGGRRRGRINPGGRGRLCRLSTEHDDQLRDSAVLGSEKDSPENGKQVGRVPGKLLNSRPESARVLRREPGPHETESDEHYSQVQESAGANTPCESNTAMEELVEHDRVDDASNGCS